MYIDVSDRLAEHHRLSAEIEAARAADRAVGQPPAQRYSHPRDDNARPDRDHS